MIPRLTCRHSDDGVGMVEVLIAVMLLSVVGGLFTNAITTSFRYQRQQSEHQRTLNGVKLAFERTTRDLRAADEIQQASLGPHSLNLRVCRGGVNRWISYSLDATTNPARFVTQDPTGSAPRIMARSLTAPVTPTFRYFNEAGAELTFPTANPAVTAADITAITVRLRASAGSPVELQNRITLRNKGGVPCG